MIFESQSQTKGQLNPQIDSILKLDTKILLSIFFQSLMKCKEAE